MATSGPDAASVSVNSTSDRSSSSSGASLRTAFLSVALTVVATSVLALGWPWDTVARATPLSWWMVAILAIVTDVLVFHLEFRRETYTFTFAEVLLVLGLFLASPVELIIGRIVGEVLVLVLKERQPPRKVVLNLAMFYAECVVLLAVYRALDGGPSITAPASWAVAVVAIVLAESVGFVTVAQVIRWHGGPFDLRSIARAGLITAPVNISLGLTAGILWIDQPWATPLLGGVAVFLFLTYRAYAGLSRRHESLSLLYDFTRLMSSSKRSDDILEAILVQAKDLLRAERAELWIGAASGGTGGVAFAVDETGRFDAPGRDELGLRLLDEFTRAQGPIVVTDRDARTARRELAAHFGAADCIVAPIVEGGHPVGFIVAADRMGEVSTFDASDARLFDTLAGHASIALENGRLIDRLHDEARQREHDSLHDPLTGLGNRLLLNRRLADRLAVLGGPAGGGHVAVAVMDIDGFKEINDTLGHESGDVVLIEVAHRLARAVDRSATVVRLGGDEFAFVFCFESLETLDADLTRLQSVVAAPMPMNAMMLEVGASFGVATTVADGLDAVALVQRADVAMYAAKGRGGGHAFYSEEQDTNTPRRLTLTNDLRSAIGSGQLFCLYQPKATVAGEIVGAEALVRWLHPTLGPVYPDEFIGLAERSGLIAGLTRFVLATALETASGWHRAGLPISISVNLSVRNLLDNDLPDTIADLLLLHGVAPELVVLEVTESTAMTDPELTIEVLERLAALGVKISIDDFGTGYSSLSYLQRLPARELKIDKSFVLPMTASPSAGVLVRSIIDLAHNLGLSVVAEGVEDQATWDQLSAFGCDLIQGYHLARPIPAAEVAAMRHAASVD